MSALHEEIYSQFYNSCFDEGGYNEFTQDDAQKMVNKVLDAAVEALTECLESECVDVGSGDVMIEAINKLREIKID